MRRGLIAWSKEEVPESALDARRARLQSAMKTGALDAVLVHTCFPRPAAVSWLTNFVPYWSEALLVVPQEGPPTMLASLSKRVHGWIREVSHMGEIVAAPHLGRGAAQVLQKALGTGGARRIGIVGLSSFARTHAEPIQQTFGAGCLVDATALFASVRQPADDVERALIARATMIAEAALSAMPSDARTVGALASAIERSARLAGAEECIILVAPDLSADPTLRRIEGEAPLGARHAVQVSVAYKMGWVRVARCRTVDGWQPESWRAADRWFEAASAGLSASGPDHSTVPSDALADWAVEACIGPAPLSPIAAMGRTPVLALPPGTPAVLSARLALADGSWLRAGPVVLRGG